MSGKWTKEGLAAHPHPLAQTVLAQRENIRELRDKYATEERKVRDLAAENTKLRKEIARLRSLIGSTGGE